MTSVNENKFLSRKWIMGILIILLASIFLAMNTLTAIAWGGIVVSIYSGYLISNVTQKGVINDSQ
jgi:hypothetical protein